MASDPTAWSEVWLALAGAPLGAGITVLGVWLTNRHNTVTNQAMLEGQAAQQRARLEFELRAELQRETLRQRSDIYENVLELAEDAIHLASWGGADVLPDDQSPITNSDLLDIKARLPILQHRVGVHCSSDVRAQFGRFRDSLRDIWEVSPTEQWDALATDARELQDCVISAAIQDRSGGAADDGLGGM
ncbi:MULTISPECIES: hypothetical protein [unclassified Aeromicrobium]|uniref:hypothetical protein n=1 Tax=unclassified Aeromicrobium TaxID=2633570 RepID=UPI00396B1A81